MDTETRERLVAKLEAERERLEREVIELEGRDRESLSEASGENAYRDHMADQGSATFERELDLTLEENLRMRLADVRAAMDRVTSGAYGTCERCGTAIPAERLEAVPTASLCIQCKEAEESR